MKCDAPAVGLISTHNYTLFTQLLSYVLIVVSSVLGFVLCLCICIYKKRKLDMKWFSENFLFMENINISTNVFSSVPASQFPWVTLLRESPIAKIADNPMSHIPEGVYKSQVEWINKQSTKVLHDFFLSSFSFDLFLEIPSDESKFAPVDSAFKKVKEIPEVEIRLLFPVGLLLMS
ncbi:transmembrane protein 214-like protein [Tanacetum coccineum]